MTISQALHLRAHELLAFVVSDASQKTKNADEGFTGRLVPREAQLRIERKPIDASGSWEKKETTKQIHLELSH